MIATPRCVIVNVNNAAGELKFFSILINTLTRTKFEDIIAAKSTAGMVPMVYFQFIFINNFPNSLNYFYFLVSFLFLSVTKMYILFWCLMVHWISSSWLGGQMWVDLMTVTAAFKYQSDRESYRRDNVLCATCAYSRT